MAANLCPFDIPSTILRAVRGEKGQVPRGELSYETDIKSKFWALEPQDVTLPSPHFGHVILGDFPPVLLYQIGKHETRALIDVADDLQSLRDPTLNRSIFKFQGTEISTGRRAYLVPSTPRSAPFDPTLPPPPTLPQPPPPTPT
ncbi:hypothetical protein G7Y89_g5792 [Cudoniella acicularis]|uniref:Squalene epoxidase domain-containing protein n=1 Tax=Cudoniella acicularis TaxID=354080 RepID=A0A8H4RML5_9HELO|nr:hypothetical protein G7Y89_g5792 [Cudoniella acicularis]